MGKRKKTKVESKKKKWRFSFKIPRFLMPKDEAIIPRVFSIIDYAGGILVFFICWAVYLHTLTPTIGLHDSGDMVTAAYLLGIPHPTGYPLYCLLGKLWMTILPIGNIVYRMNLASALCASLACMMVYFIILKVGSNLSDVVKKGSSEKETPSLIHSFTSSLPLLVPAVVGALMLAFATTFWEQAVIAEKYTLNALFATLIIFILLKWQESMSMKQRTQNSLLKAQRWLYLFAFILGLSFTHHMQTLYLVPASIFFIIVLYWGKLRQERQSLHTLLITNYLLFFKMLCLFILPLCLYLYLPIQASVHPLYNWDNPCTLNRVIDYLSAESYREIYFTSTSILPRLEEYLSTFFTLQYTPYIIVISLIGLCLCFFKKRIFLFFYL